MDRGAWWAASLQGCKESDTTEVTQHTHTAYLFYLWLQLPHALKIFCSFLFSYYLPIKCPSILSSLSFSLILFHQHRKYLFYLKTNKQTSTSLDTVGSSVSLCFLSIYASGKCVNILYSGFFSFHCIFTPLLYGYPPIFFKEISQHSELLQFQRLQVSIPLFEFLLYFTHKTLYSKHPILSHHSSPRLK